MKRKGILLFLICLFLSGAVTYWVADATFTSAQTSVLFLLVFSISLWVTEAVPPFSVGILVIAFLAYSLGYRYFTSAPVDISLYVNTFSSSVVWLMLGGFFLASAMTKAKLDEDLLNWTLRICGSDPRYVLLGIMAVTMVASMLISNTATTSMVIAALMPLLLRNGKNSSISKAFILGIPIAATTGGMGTLIGSPPNAMVAGALADMGQSINFVRWMYFGVPVCVLLTVTAWFALTKLFLREPKKLSRPATSGERDSHPEFSKTQRWVVMIVLSTTFILWLISPLLELSAAAISALPLVILPMSGIVTGADIRGMGWDTLLLVAGGLALGLGLQQTGLMERVGNYIISADVSETSLLFMLAYATMLFSNIMSNTASTAILVPLGLAMLPGRPLEIAMIVGLSASTALFLPVSTPPNAIAYSTGLIEQKDLRIGGVLIGLVGPAVIVLWVLLLS